MEDSEIYFEIKDSADFIRLQPIGLSHPDATSKWDTKWIDTQISVRAGAFVGVYMASLLVEDFFRLEQQLSKLYKNLSGKTTFGDLEGYLELEITGDGYGHFEVLVKATDDPGLSQNQLMFSLDIDQTFMPELVRQLDAVYRHFSG